MVESDKHLTKEETLQYIPPSRFARSAGSLPLNMMISRLFQLLLVVVAHGRFL